MLLLPIIQAGNLANASKEQLLAYADELVDNQASDGWDCVELLALWAKLEMVAERVKERAKIAAMSDVRAYGKAGIMRAGVVMTVRASGGKLDYSNDPVWQSLHEVVEHANARLKQHQDLLKALPHEGTLLLNPDTAERYTAHPPAKASGDTIYLEIK